jgi:membrane protease YdiL (CAAX protease family)
MQAVLPIPADSASIRRIAHPLHTVIFLAGEGALVVRAAMHAEQMRTAVNLNRVHMYERTMLTEWLGFAFVLLGVWLAKADFATVLGELWRSARAVLRDVGLGVAFSIASTIVLSMLQPHEGGGGDRAVQFLLPHGSYEMTLWVALSITAGICEEAIYRGYLQRQFTALSKNVPAGIVISGVAFGLAHSYQGWRMAIVIGLEGMMLGAMAQWRKSVRPGMVAHAFKDAVAPMLMSAMRH